MALAVQRGDHLAGAQHAGLSDVRLDEDVPALATACRAPSSMSPATLNSIC